MLDPRNIDLMLAKPFKPFSREGWLYELKYDGYRLLVARSGDKVLLMTRNKKDATNWYPEIVEAALELDCKNFIMDGEVCVLDAHGRPDFEALQYRSAFRRRAAGTRPVVYFAFDLIGEEAEDLRPLPLHERKQRLREIVPKGPKTLMCVTHVDDGLWLYEQVVALELEGIVAKRIDSPYVAGYSDYWRKSKPAGYHRGWGRKPKTDLGLPSP